MRYRVEELRSTTFELLTKQGLHPDPACVVADILMEGDLLGHTTHGLRIDAAKPIRSMQTIPFGCPDRPPWTKNTNPSERA